MCTSEQDFKRAVEDLCKDRDYHADYVTVGSDPEVCIMARIRGRRSGRRVEVILTGKDYSIIVPQTPIKKSFTKQQLNLVIDCIKDLLENPVVNQ
jgi:hypothetical protein